VIRTKAHGAPHGGVSVAPYIGTMDFARRAALVLLPPLALSAGCDLFAPRDPEVEFETKTCGSLEDHRSPDPEVSEKTAVLSGAVRRLDDGGLEVVIAPLIVGTADVTAELDAEAMEVSLDGEAVTEFDLQRVSEEVPAAVDIMFVLDTTGSMLWAIDGVKAGIDLFLDGVDATGIDARVGGIEFGDEIRSDTMLGDTDELRRWLDLLTATGGGDGPESPLDSMEKAYRNADWRDGALPYFIVITDVGMHEQTDDTDCSETNLANTTELIEGNALITVVHAGTRGGPGVDPDWLVRAMGGLYVALDGSFLFSDFDVSLDTPADDILANTHVLRVPASDAAASASEIELKYEIDGETVTFTAPID